MCIVGLAYPSVRRMPLSFRNLIYEIAMTNELRMFLEALVAHPITVNYVWLILAGVVWISKMFLWILLWSFVVGCIVGLVRVGERSDRELFRRD